MSRGLDTHEGHKDVRTEDDDNLSRDGAARVSRRVVRVAQFVTASVS